MSIYDLKPRFQNLLRPVCKQFAAIGISANQITISAVILSIFSGAMLVLFSANTKTLFVIPVILFLRMALNAIDGMLAREHEMKSDLGALLNELGDIVSDTAIYLPFACIPGLPPAGIVLFVLFGCLTETAGILGQQIGGTRRYDGPMGKSDRAFAMGLLAFLLAVGIAPGIWSTIYIVVLIFLSVVTLFKRSIKTLAEAES